MMDKYGNKEARAEIAMIKVAAPNMACRVIDWAIQAFGGAGVTGDYGLAYAYATARVLRLADGPIRGRGKATHGAGKPEITEPTLKRAPQSSDANSAGRPKEPQPYSLFGLAAGKVAAQERYHY